MNLCTNFNYANDSLYHCEYSNFYRNKETASIPVVENLCIAFSLILTSQSRNLGVALVDRLLKFQANDGTFPDFIHNYSSRGSIENQVQCTIIVHQIAEYLSEYKQAVTKSYNGLCFCYELTTARNLYVKLVGIGLNTLDRAEWGEVYFTEEDFAALHLMTTISALDTLALCLTMYTAENSITQSLIQHLNSYFCELNGSLILPRLLPSKHGMFIGSIASVALAMLNSIDICESLYRAVLSQNIAMHSFRIQNQSSKPKHFAVDALSPIRYCIHESGKHATIVFHPFHMAIECSGAHIHSIQARGMALELHCEYSTRAVDVKNSDEIIIYINDASLVGAVNGKPSLVASGDEVLRLQKADATQVVSLQIKKACMISSHLRIIRGNRHAAVEKQQDTPYDTGVCIKTVDRYGKDNKKASVVLLIHCTGAQQE